LFGANGGANKSSADLINLENVEPDLTNNEENSINVDLIFRKKIKVI